MLNEGKMLRIAKDEGYANLKDAVSDYRKKGVTNIRIREKFGFTVGQLDNYLQRTGISKIKMDPEDSDLFEYCDSLMTEKKRKNIFSKVKFLGYSTVTGAIFDLSKKMMQKDVAALMGVSAPFICAKMSIIRGEQRYRDGIEPRPVQSKRGPKKKKSLAAAKAVKIKNKDKKKCTCCKVRYREGYFLCNVCYRTYGDSSFDNPDHAGGVGRLG